MSLLTALARNYDLLKVTHRNSLAGEVYSIVHLAVSGIGAHYGRLMQL
jgi:hypothetical protein